MTVGTSQFRHWYEYNSRGLLWKVTGATSSTKPSTADVTYSYRPSGQVQDRRFGSGVTVPFRYTIREQLERIGDPATTTYPFSARYAYHPNGTISQAEFYSAGSPAANKRYRYVFGTASYDALNRLRSADYSHWSGSAWTSTLAHDLTGITYDAAGNLRTLQRYRETGTLIDNLTYSYSTGSNRLSSVTDTVTGNAETWDAKTGSFTYDASGNLLSAPAPYSITATTYGYRHLPVRVTNGGVTTNYRYDHNGQRFSKQTGSGNTRYYILDGATTLGQFTLDGAGNVASSSFRFVAGERVVGRFSGTSSRRYFHTDLLGSTRAVILGTSNQVESYDYDPWGVLMPGRTLGSGTLEGFTSKERDAETGLDYFGARYYMSALGRWTTVDPLSDEYAGWSPYNYVLNNPAAFTDPDGRCSRPGNISRGQVGICIGSFIAARRIGGVGLGDNRGPIGDDAGATYRSQVQLVIDPSNGSIVHARTDAGKSSVFVKALGRRGTASSNITTPTVDTHGNMLFTVSTTATNGLSFLPGAPKESIDIAIQIIVTSDGRVGVTGGSRDAYPSLEVFAYDDKGATRPILHIHEAKPEDLKPPMEQRIPTKVPH